MGGSSLSIGEFILHQQVTEVPAFDRLLDLDAGVLRGEQGHVPVLQLHVEKLSASSIYVVYRQ